MCQRILNALKSLLAIFNHLRLCSISSLTVCLQSAFSEKFGRVLDPGECLAMILRSLGERTDRPAEFLAGAESARAPGLVSDHADEDLYYAQPRPLGSRDMGRDLAILRLSQPAAYLGMLGGAVVVHHDMQLYSAVGGRHRPQESQQLLMAGVTCAGRLLYGGRLQRREQCAGAIALVIA